MSLHNGAAASDDKEEDSWSDAGETAMTDKNSLGKHMKTRRHYKNTAAAHVSAAFVKKGVNQGSLNQEMGD